MHNSALRRITILLMMGLITAALIVAILTFSFGVFSSGTTDSGQDDLSRRIGVYASSVFLLIYVILVNSTAVFFLRRSTDKKIEKLIRETEDYLEKITSPLGRVIEKKTLEKTKLIYELMSITRIRLLDYIGSLRDRNFVNLSFGLLPVFAAVVIFLFTFSRIENLQQIDEMRVYYYVFAVLFVQSFSFFFLNMFRKTLTDIKYYQNELSNFEMKMSSLLIAQAADNKDLVSEILSELAKSERNFILQKDEKVVQSDSGSASTNTELLSKILGKLSGGN